MIFRKVATTSPPKLSAPKAIATTRMGRIFADTPFSRMRENVKNMQFLTGPRFSALPVGRCKQK